MTINQAQAESAEHVLIIHVARMDEVLLATPAIRAIAAYFPNASLTFLGHAGDAAVLAQSTYLTKVGHVTPQTTWLRGWRDAMTQPEYDYAFVWGEDESLVRYALRKARRVIAQRQRDLSLNAGLAFAVDLPPRNSLHAVAWFFALPRAVGIDVPTESAARYALDYVVSADERKTAANTLFGQLGASNHYPKVGFQVAGFAGQPLRDWPIQRFIDLGLHIIQHYPDARFVCFGSASDQPRIEELERSLKSRVLSFAGTTSLRETAALMSYLDLYVGVDSGFTRLYGALKKPMVGLYHPALPSALHRPLAHPSLAAIDHPLAGPDCRADLPMSELDSERIWRAVERMLEGEASQDPGMAAPGIDDGVPSWPAVTQPDV
jgi:heptosyltransferase III